ncbi:hypothetical protein [Rhizobium etli]|uniref:hypothetical protein n=1 Tax=Rhizobium etli TaxID=29449 RepID=UPI0005709F97|nr:hypothetical protein [Rhizobium sp. IE4771]
MTYEKIAGGPELQAWFRQKPTFHDAEILSLSLNRTGVSELTIHGWTATGLRRRAIDRVMRVLRFVLQC